MGRKRDTWSNERAPYYPGTPTFEAAKFLVNVAKRYMAEKATKTEVDVAVKTWEEAKAEEVRAAFRAPIPGSFSCGCLVEQGKNPIEGAIQVGATKECSTHFLYRNGKALP